MISGLLPVASASRRSRLARLPPELAVTYQMISLRPSMSRSARHDQVPSRENLELPVAECHSACNIDPLSWGIGVQN